MWRSAKRAEFERLVREHLPAALTLADRLLNCDTSAEDVVQDAMLKASKGWRSFRGDSQFRTWFYRIVVNCARDYQRKAKSQNQLPENAVDTNVREPVEKLQAAEFSSLVQIAVQQLPDRQREVLVLSAFEQLGADEIASALLTSTANVSSTLHLARKRLKALLQPYFAEQE